jgi:hypothetical protein
MFHSYSVHGCFLITPPLCSTTVKTLWIRERILSLLFSKNGYKLRKIEPTTKPSTNNSILVFPDQALYYFVCIIAHY